MSDYFNASKMAIINGHVRYESVAINNGHTFLVIMGILAIMQVFDKFKLHPEISGFIPLYPSKSVRLIHQQCLFRRKDLR